MPRKCCVNGCENRFVKSSFELQENKQKKNLSFHRFPIADAALHAEWQQAARNGNTNWTIPAGEPYICSDHFQETDFIPRQHNRCLRRDIRVLPSLLPLVKQQSPQQKHEKYRRPPLGLRPLLLNWAAVINKKQQTTQAQETLPPQPPAGTFLNQPESSGVPEPCTPQIGQPLQGRSFGETVPSGVPRLIQPGPFVQSLHQPSLVGAPVSTPLQNRPPLQVPVLNQTLRSQPYLPSVFQPGPLVQRPSQQKPSSSGAFLHRLTVPGPRLQGGSVLKPSSSVSFLHRLTVPGPNVQGRYINAQTLVAASLPHHSQTKDATVMLLEHSGVEVQQTLHKQSEVGTSLNQPLSSGVPVPSTEHQGPPLQGSLFNHTLPSGASLPGLLQPRPILQFPSTADACLQRPSVPGSHAQEPYLHKQVLPVLSGVKRSSSHLDKPAHSQVALSLTRNQNLKNRRLYIVLSVTKHTDVLKDGV